MSGTRTFPQARPRPDRGLFDPASITWQVHSDPLMGIAGLRALLLQALHPLTMAAVSAHHDAPWDPWQRLVRTTEYVGVTTYGTAAQAMLAGSRLRAVHARIYGTTRSGRPFAAEDPGLLAWVHACLVASFLEIVTRGGLSLPGRAQDGYIAEQVRTAALVGLEPGEVPRDRAELVAYVRQVRPSLAVTRTARDAAWSVVSGREPRRAAGAPVPDRPAWADVAGLAFATLPPWARRLYALPELPGAAGLGDAAATVALRELRTWLQAARESRAPDRPPPAP
ncbi:MAG TPA: oxygenase MpaB family protein [Kineosporiaceae bacterium]|nr:oxygenase MpaB family protein [Kineosporiaceae bacterium]